MIRNALRPAWVARRVTSIPIAAPSRSTMSAAIALLVTRLATHAGRSALRIIDYVGPEDAVPDLGPIIQAGMRRTGAEYADVYNWGIDPALFGQAGFSAIDLDGPDIVPDHFEPFEARNSSIRFAVKSSRPVVFFRGDGDQDRPNWIPA